MISTGEIEQLKILCWCKNMPFPNGKLFNSIYNSNLVEALAYFNLISISKDGDHIRPRKNAYRLLETAGYSFKSDNKVQTRARTLTRRHKAAQVLMTFYLAGTSVFEERLPEYIQNPVYIASFAARHGAGGTNPFSTLKFYGVFATQNETYIVYYVDDKGGIFYLHERRLFNSFTEHVNTKNTSIIFMGESTKRIADIVLNTKNDIKKVQGFNHDTYANIYHDTLLPVYFVPVGESGAQMLKLLAIPNAREILAKNVMGRKYKPPYDGMTDTDAIHYVPPYNPASHNG